MKEYVGLNDLSMEGISTSYSTGHQKKKNHTTDEKLSTISEQMHKYVGEKYFFIRNIKQIVLEYSSKH